MPLEELQKGGLLGSNLPNGNLRVNNNDNETLTINGGRMIYADLVGPKNGVIHVIDRVLFPFGDRNLLQTIKDCNKFDGFLSLVKFAELNDILTDVGPYTIFLPTNDALAKMPKDEYSIYKSNKTALKDFLLYHMVFGAYFSSDLRDGHYLETGQQSASIRVSVRVDGCQRRLVEVNASPVYLTDIPASNGVIHILDWVLSPNDLDWCSSFSS
ncbi:uncharacterized protein sll1735-like [Centruroides vittatus]|uniref:uncharacterized protein sll1735-like n=1 Tax=Centruroides vittatus TaxID=120091 RepID=UPI00351028EC